MSVSTTDPAGGTEQMLDDRVEITQHSVPSILAIWAAAALPMGALAWLVTPRLADRFAGTGPVPMAKALIITLTIGLIWQFVLVTMLVRREQGTLRWGTVRRALWLVPPRSPRTGRMPRRRSTATWACPPPTSTRSHSTGAAAIKRSASLRARRDGGRVWESNPPDLFDRSHRI